MAWKKERIENDKWLTLKKTNVIENKSLGLMENDSNSYGCHNDQKEKNELQNIYDQLLCLNSIKL